MRLDLVCMSLLLATFLTEPSRAEAPRPNILVILTDDLGYGDLATYGHPIIQTPNLDKLAGQGVKLTACYSASPVCSPSRVGLLTGRTPSRAGVYDWIPEGHAMHLQHGEITIPMLLKKAGYKTAMAGKWHCNGKFNTEEQPQPDDFGFDHWFATQNNAAPSHENPRNFVRNGSPVGPLEGYSCRIVADEAIAWLEANKAQPAPFFLYVAFHEPHEPVASPPELVSRYSTTNELDRAQYFANVTNLDAAVGRLMQALDHLNLSEDTLVIFTSDNGPETLNRYPNARRSYGSPGPLRGMKLWMYEAGIRVPGIIRYPGVIQPGQVWDETVCSLDFLPTFCDLAGVDTPRDRELDGTSLVSLLKGEPFSRTKPLYWHYYRSYGEPAVTMRSGDWTLLAHVEQKPKPGLPLLSDTTYIRSPLKRFELYNIKDDLKQEHDLAGSEPQRLGELSKILIEKHRSVITEAPAWDRVGKE